MVLEKKELLMALAQIQPLSINCLKQFKMMSEMMKKMSKGNLKGMSDKGIPPELFNQLK
jgi:signal recognition particle subunit SRP54